ncbi:beta-glucan synthesis-associated [Eremomyces bilateralis CBS 781.70]|uniref:Beta-glucan synthesis-associated n=1 Tax=Eremomyces bilateralis CBS 781.70 TaxID=1392243 RepID=A0A6G1G1V6_9PEZI|nr:beta-glucan synthesis-associated [Eremomyces bilateralis CBS 781.70]KAF1811789.1 beta-glucan synthesis-associated [Eremomyces bilateralis CBS 781.70]
MTLHELGSDYSRYFNPFSDCRRSSFLSTPGVPAPSALLSSDESIRTAALPGASTTKLPTDPEMEKFFPLDDRLSAPYAVRGMYSFPLFLDEKEPDDDMHMPYPDDDVRFRPRLRDHFSRANICSTIGLIMMISGILFLFVVFPVLSYTSVVHFSGSYDTPIDEMPDQVPEPQPWATVNDRHHPLLRYMRRGLIDPDTPSHAKTRKSVDGSDLILVFSDEFNDNNRTFYPGDDPYFFAPDFWYGATQDLEWYDPDAVTTWDGVLELRLDQFDNHNLKFRSGMLNTWNQACFKGGVFEVSISLPGPAGVMGLWPGAWTMGNLGRPGYLATTEGMWPYTYDECDVGITPNQSMTDGTSRLPGQRLPACTCPGADHPTPGRGRGAPEIDIIEASADWSGIPVATQSYQVAPFDIWYYPDYEFTACPNPAVSLTNSYTGGPFQQAVSTTTSLNKRWFDGQAYQKYAFEYTPGTGAKGKISWFVGEEMVYQVDGRAIGPNGNVGSRVVSEEPMSIVLNLGISNSWVNIDWAKLKFPTIMRIDYVRWYQPKGKTMVTCDPPGFETTEYIKNHPEPYNNQNLTVSEDHKPVMRSRRVLMIE